MEKIVLVDNGHGRQTPGKCSPDGSLREYAWTRDIARKLVARLTAKGIEARVLVPEEDDVSLGERVRRVNAVCKERGKGNVLLISLHCNAAGADGQWHQARGWEVYLCRGASRAARELAQLLRQAAEKRALTDGRCIPPEGYWTKDLYILRRTACPAVLTENLFMDSRRDCARLLTTSVQDALVALHVEAIQQYLKR